MLIDPYFKAFFQHQAEMLWFNSGEPVMIQLQGKKHPLTKEPISTELLTRMILELAPEFKIGLEAGEVKFKEYVFDNQKIRIFAQQVSPHESQLIAAGYDISDSAVMTYFRKQSDSYTGYHSEIESKPDEASVEPTPQAAPKETKEEKPLPEATDNGVYAREDLKLPATAPSPYDPLRPDIPEPVLGETILDPYFRALMDNGGSDLYICSEKQPLMRKDGDLVKIVNAKFLTPEAAETLLFSITPKAERVRFRETNDVDFSYEIPGLARFRCNIFRDRNGIGGIFRQIPSEILTAKQLNLSNAILELCNLNKGLVVVTGPTGSGKSTTLAAMIDHINKTKQMHIITIEDPIEFVHQDQRCVFNQREIRNHTDGFKKALKAALREDPDIVLVGEMRDLETIEIAIETAETGHLVFGTLHTNTAPSTIDRIIDQFPPDRQAQIRTMLSESLKGVVAQTLCKKIGGGRIAAQEILIGTSAMSNLIREGKTFQIPSIMQTGKGLGMQTMNDALLQHVLNEKVTPEEAYFKSVDKAEFLKALEEHNIHIETVAEAN